MSVRDIQWEHWLKQNSLTLIAASFPPCEHRQNARVNLLTHHFLEACCSRIITYRTSGHSIHYDCFKWLHVSQLKCYDSKCVDHFADDLCNSILGQVRNIFHSTELCARIQFKFFRLFFLSLLRCVFMKCYCRTYAAVQCLLCGQMLFEFNMEYMFVLAATAVAERTLNLNLEHFNCKQNGPDVCRTSESVPVHTEQTITWEFLFGRMSDSCDNEWKWTDEKMSCVRDQKAMRWLRTQPPICEIPRNLMSKPDCSRCAGRPTSAKTEMRSVNSTVSATIVKS